MAELYRVRTIAQLLGCFKELEKQEIYFAHPSDLNDPMEGIRNIFWLGDQIVWNNLFKHYIHCLHMTIALYRFLGDVEVLQPHHIPVDHNRNSKAAQLSDDIFDIIFTRARLGDFTAKLAASNRKIHRHELLLYLYSLHRISINAIDMHAACGLSSKTPGSTASKFNFKSFHELLASPPVAQDGRGDLDLGFMEAVLALEEIMTFQKIALSSKKPCTIEEANRLFMCFDFPKIYVEQLEASLFPDWYVACFLRSCSNSSIWANYGDRHKGVCLIFKTDDDNSGGDCIALKQITGYSNRGADWRYSPMRFYEVNYGPQRDGIDFFRSLGQLPEGKAIEMWYKDADGNISECGSHIGGNIKSWRKKYWARYYPSIVAKTCDWKHEQESRLILYSLMGRLTKSDRKLEYKFNSLKGVIFGIRTSDSDKRKIIELIRNKCADANRLEFQFYQAYYNPRTGNIGKHKMIMDLSA